MKLTLDLPDYSPASGLRLVWSPGAEITVESGPVTRVRANAAGLESLARHLLSLAQANVPAGQHVHLDDSNGLEDGSSALVIERI